MVQNEGNQEGFIINDDLDLSWSATHYQHLSVVA